MEFEKFARIMEKVCELSRKGWIFLFDDQKIECIHPDNSVYIMESMEELGDFIVCWER